MQQRSATRRARDEYQEKRRIEKRVHRKRKREWMKQEMKQLESLHEQKNVRQMYKLVNNTKDVFKPRTHSL